MTFFFVFSRVKRPPSKKRYEFMQKSTFPRSSFSANYSAEYSSASFFVIIFPYTAANMLSDLFRHNRTQTRGHVEFINTALNYLKEYGLHKDLETYKALLNVFPKGKMIPTNSFQKMFLHFPVQQNCCVKVLDLMEWHGVQPDKEVHDIVANAFGEWNFATKKIKRMLYWMPKLKHSNKYLDRRLVENKNLKAVELATIALKMMARDSGTNIDYAHYTHSIEFDDKWIVSAQSPLQRAVLAQLEDKSQLYVDAPRSVYVMDQRIEYAVLSTDPLPESFEEFDDDDVEDANRFETWKSPWERDPFSTKRNLHQQTDQTILGLAVFEECTQEAAAAWVNYLQKFAPRMSEFDHISSMEDQRERAYKLVAYSAVTFSLIAILSVCITMPIVYNFVDHIQEQTKKDLQFCKASLPTYNPFHF
ncbi:hypothetical protein QR680_003441 [Steinernema hermaphroditum]|uniref:Evolutionarily conserved signaling intermediate in Toll pathway, mitochondrial n=1 Tax=Steinernema hermaphroditum TaxID=289476 RepID=A0AA39H8N0_9BILA|nr:hypothetical protein QR680_003441 [Steinernema hermaphroditum]